MEERSEVQSSQLTDIEQLLEPRERVEAGRRGQLSHSYSVMSVDSVESAATVEPGSEPCDQQNGLHRARSEEYTGNSSTTAAAIKRRRMTRDGARAVGGRSRFFRSESGRSESGACTEAASDNEDNDFAEPKAPPQPQPLAPIQQDKQPMGVEAAGDERNTCPVCMEAWTIGGATRLVSLRCGHLFCNRCIRKWMRSAMQGRKRAKCPECNQAVNKGDVRPIYARSITAVDGEQLQRLQAANRRLEERARELEAQLNTMETRFNDMRSNTNRLGQALSEATDRADWLAAENKAIADQMAEIRSRGEGAALAPPEFRPVVRLRATHRPGGGASMRRLAISPHAHTVYATYSQPSLGIHTLAQVDVHGANTKPFVLPPLHTAEIRAAEPSPHESAPHYMLTASTDRSAVLVSLDAAPNIAARLQLPQPGWTCAWDPVSPTGCYVGTARGQVLAFDLRRPSEPLHVWDGPRQSARLAADSCGPVAVDMSPIGSIAVAPYEAAGGERQVRLVVANASRVYALPPQDASGGAAGCPAPWVQLTPSAAETDITRRACYSMAYDSKLGCMAASFRTALGKAQAPALVHELYSVAFDAQSLAPATCLMRQRITVDSVQTMWARSSMFSYLDACSIRRGLFCAGVEKSRSAMAWDASIVDSDAQQRMLLNLDDAKDEEGPVLDLRGFQWGSNGDGPASGPTVLASLTQSTIRIYDVR